jgi:nitroreductase
MDFSTTVNSIRAFPPTNVRRETIHSILAVASRALSAANSWTRKAHLRSAPFRSLQKK